jgi:hypothetical protein
MTMWCLCFACWIPKATNTHSKSATMVARMRLNVTLYYIACRVFYSHNSSKAEGTLMTSNFVDNSQKRYNSQTLGFISLDVAHNNIDVYRISTTNKRVNVSTFLFNRSLFEFIMSLQTNRMKMLSL